jgi:succinate-acetate transporter protein
MAYYLGIWGIFTIFFFIGTFKLNRALQIVFGSLVILFFMLAIGDATGNAQLKTLAGYEGIFCGSAAIYTGMANLLNEVYGKTIMPIGPMS